MKVDKEIINTIKYNNISIEQALVQGNSTGDQEKVKEEYRYNIESIFNTINEIFNGYDYATPISLVFNKDNAIVDIFSEIQLNDDKVKKINTINYTVKFFDKHLYILSEVLDYYSVVERNLNPRTVQKRYLERVYYYQDQNIQELLAKGYHLYTIRQSWQQYQPNSPLTYPIIEEIKEVDAIDADYFRNRHYLGYKVSVENLTWQALANALFDFVNDIYMIKNIKKDEE